MAKVFPSIKAQLRDPGGRGADDLALNTGSELTSAPGNHAVLLNYRSSQPGWGCVQLGGSVCVLGFWGKFEVQTGLMAIYSWPSSRHSTKFLQFYFGKLLAAFGNYFYFKDTVPWCFAVGMCICRANSECEKMAGDFIQPQWAGNASHLCSFVQFLSTAKRGGGGTMHGWPLCPSNPVMWSEFCEDSALGEASGWSLYRMATFMKMRRK